MRVCDVVAKFLYQKGVDTVFLVTGGGMMFLTDGLACCPEIRKVPCHHEQAAAMAAVAYAKYKGIGAAFATTGCGGTNMITGLLHAWQDNVPCFFVTGQCNTFEMMDSRPGTQRQYGVQEADVVPIVSSVTKYAVTVMEPESILYHLEKAYYLAKSGRPGPVWLDIPMDVQERPVEEAGLEHFIKEEREPAFSKETLHTLAGWMRGARRPAVLIGQGVRLSGAIQQVRNFSERHNIPVVATKLGVDIFPSRHPLFMGMIGTRGTRSGNYTLQNADLVLVLGSRLALVATGYNFKLFAREAKVAVVDIDPEEHRKGTVPIDLFIESDIRLFMDALGKEELPDYTGSLPGRTETWAERCRNFREKYPVCTPEHYQVQGAVSMYAFMNELSARIGRTASLVTDAGSTAYVPSQAMIFQEGQRYLGSGAQGEMGYALPGAIGASYANPDGVVACITGDGSLQMNIQELQTLYANHCNVKVFVWNNHGYRSIREHQAKVFQGRFLGVDDTSGLPLPKLDRLCHAYGLPFYHAACLEELKGILDQLFVAKGPAVCEVRCMDEEPILAAVSNKRTPDGKKIPLPLEDMAPFLDREAFQEEMLIKPVEW